MKKRFQIQYDVFLAMFNKQTDRQKEKKIDSQTQTDKPSKEQKGDIVSVRELKKNPHKPMAIFPIPTIRKILTTLIPLYSALVKDSFYNCPRNSAAGF